MSEFEFPANVKQIGSISGGLKIYMEDYVCSYLQQYAESGGYKELIAYLIGRSMVIDGQQVLFISGAIQGRETLIDNGITVFTGKSLDYAREQIGKYFDGMEIVGWMQSQPGYGIFLNSGYAAYHMSTFVRSYQAMFVIDPIEKLNTFYTWGETSLDLKESKGYFIYYEKNDGMHEYMLDNRLKIHKRVFHEEELSQPEEEEPPAVEDEPPLRIPRILRSDSERARPSARRSYREPTKRGDEPKRVINMLVSLSAVLVMICFVMGAGLVQNEGRITNLESELIKLNTSYKNLLVQIKDENSAAVFAPADESGEDEMPDEQASVIREDGNQVMMTTTTTTTPTPEPVTPSEPVTPPEQVSQQPVASGNVTTAASSIPDTYTVQQGDNLSYISMLFYGNREMVEKIMEVNGMDNPDKIYFGKVLVLPRP